jgi:hypothetical protein
LNGNQETRAILTTIVVVVLVLILLPALIMSVMLGGMMAGGTGMMGWGNPDTYAWGGSAWWGWLTMLLWETALIGGSVIVARWVLRRDSSAGETPDRGRRALGDGQARRAQAGDERCGGNGRDLHALDRVDGVLSWGKSNADENYGP